MPRTRTNPTPHDAPTGFRRRYPLELTPSEHDLLETLARRVGSKRAAILQGLTALQQTETSGAAVERAREETARAREEAAALKERIGDLEAELTRANATAKGATTRQRTLTREAERQQLDAEHRANLAEQDLADEQAAHQQTQRDLQAARARLVAELRCARCGNYAPPGEWAQKTAPDGVHVYHKPCGYHPETAFKHSTILGRNPTKPK